MKDLVDNKEIHWRKALTTQRKLTGMIETATRTFRGLPKSKRFEIEQQQMASEIVQVSKQIRVLKRTIRQIKAGAKNDIDNVTETGRFKDLQNQIKKIQSIEADIELRKLEKRFLVDLYRENNYDLMVLKLALMNRK